MAPFFTFFKQDGLATYIQRLDVFYPSFVDSLHVSPPAMKKKYHGSNARFFGYDTGELVMFELDAVHLIDPIVVLTMDTFTRMSYRKWITVLRFLKKVFENTELDYETSVAIKKIVPPVLDSVRKISMTGEPEVTLKENYDFDYAVVDNICICQIEKPFTDLTYSVVIRDFDKKGFVPLFTDIFVCQSWGVTNRDVAFLEKLWVYLGMEGSLDLENRLQAAIQECKLGKPEPEVYRLDIWGVKEILAKKKKRETEPVDPSKYVKLCDDDINEDDEDETYEDDAKNEDDAQVDEIWGP